VADEIDPGAGKVIAALRYLGVEGARLTGKVVPTYQRASWRQGRPLLLAAAREDARYGHAVVGGDVEKPAVDGEDVARAADELAYGVEIALEELG